jgi:hypothetical protein
MATATGTTYTMGEVLNQIVGKNVRIFPIMYKQFKHILYPFFDIKQLAGEGGMSLSLKAMPGIETTTTQDGYKINWLDKNLFDYSTTVDGDQTGSGVDEGDTIDVVVNSVAGLAVGDKIFFTAITGGNEIDGYISAIDSGTKTLTVVVQTIDGAVPAASDWDVKDTQGVERGAWLRNDNDEILRASEVFNYTEFSSYVQHFSRRLSFTKAELNKEYAHEKDAKDYAGQKLMYNMGILFQEINKMLYKGRNLGPTNGITGKMEMLGLESVCRETNGVHDMSSSTDAEKDLFTYLTNCFKTGAVQTGEPLLMFVNDAFLAEVSRLRSDKIRYNEHVVADIGFTIPKLTTIFGEVELMRDPLLNRLYKYSVAFTAPKSLIGLWIRENQEATQGGKGITKADKSLHFYDVIDNIRERKQFDMEIELGTIFAGMSSADTPYRMITNFEI